MIEADIRVVDPVGLHRSHRGAQNRGLREAAGGKPSRHPAVQAVNPLGCRSLIVTISVKCCFACCSPGNDGEGGILALMTVTGAYRAGLERWLTNIATKLFRINDEGRSRICGVQSERTKTFKAPPASVR